MGMPPRRFERLHTEKLFRTVALRGGVSAESSERSSRYLTRSAATPSRSRTCASASGRTFIRTGRAARSKGSTAAPSFERRATSLSSDRKSNGSVARDSAAGSCSSGMHDEVMSYAMARLKADRFQRYRSKDPRLHWSHSEGALRRELDEGSHRKLIRPGGAWRREVEIFLAGQRRA
jgi:hypothetical protein